MAKKKRPLKKTERKQRGRPFAPGESGNPAGRPAGVPNKATVAAKAICAALIDDEKYRKSLKARLIAGELAPAVECMLWYYAAGKPKERVEFGADKSLAQLVTEAIHGKPDDSG